MVAQWLEQQGVCFCVSLVQIPPTAQHIYENVIFYTCFFDMYKICGFFDI
ncbi:MAG: hypothetical protein ACKO96_04875 [Flammeovirgaceae bacterium]